MAGFKVSLPAFRIRKDNSNIRQVSDTLWRELRKCNWKKVDYEKMESFDSFPSRDEYFKQKAYKQTYGVSDDGPFEPFVNTQHYAPHVDLDFAWTCNSIANKYLTQREKKIAQLWLMSGATQQEMADVLGISQATVSIELKIVKDVFKRHYLGD